jgi:uncharacterized protein (DUF885 family)
MADRPQHDPQRLRTLGSLAAAGALATAAVMIGPMAWTTEPADTPTARLEALFAEAWEAQLQAEPLYATEVGVHRYNDRLPVATEEEFARRRAQADGFLATLATIDREALDRQRQVSYDIFARLTRDRIAEIDFHAYRMPLTAGSGFHTEFPQLPDRTPFATVADYEAYLTRLRGFRTFVGQMIGLLRNGLREGQTLPRVALEGFESQIEPHLVDDPTESLLYTPFKDFPTGVPEAQRERLAATGREAVATSVVPAYRDLGRFLGEEYLPTARTSIGASELPRGDEFYRHRVRQFTTLDLPPEEIHRTGIAEVQRIRGEMEAIIRQVGFTGTFAEFLKHLRDDDRFYAKTPEELLSRVSWVLKRMDGQLPKLFRTLPRTPYGVKPVPDYLAPKIYTAYYEPPAGDGSRAGFYAVNTYNLKSRPLYEVEALSFHEAVPGHHLQLALQQELPALPEFRRFEGATAFVEGWALYSERLGLEVGFYQDPYSNFGRLTYEMWRALRLVVDTGIHAMGWSRDRAIAFMAENSALSLHNITTEVDRYISWPGQALAYKMGELKIRELRARAERALGPRFDLREFHDVILGSGAVPLSVLEDNVALYLEKRSE